MGPALRELYPELQPFAVDSLTDTDGGHSVYFEQSGNARGLPVIFLHGGPGSGADDNHRRYFDPRRYRIIIFDQRGCHRSQPAGRVIDNTTSLLLADMEAIRRRLNIDRWLVFGGSWGATLGLLYAQQHPQRVAGMILRGTFLARRRDLEWFFQGQGLSRIFPGYWQEFISIFDRGEKKNLLASCYERMTSADQALRLDTAKAWALWTGRVVTHNLDLPQPYAVKDEDADVLNQVSIECHYARHKYFIRENQIMRSVNKLPAVPVILIHGSRDLTCPPESSFLLHQALPDAALLMIDGAGHLAGEAAMVDALISSTDRMAGTLAGG